MPKCAECGFLAVTDEYQRTLVREATADARKRGFHQNENGTSTKAKFFCYANSPVFPALPVVNEPRGSFDRMVTEARLQPLCEEVACSRWRPWWPGKSPKEHEEMSMVEQMRSEYNAILAAQKELTERHHQETLTWQRQVEAAAAESRRQLALDASKAKDAATQAADRAAALAKRQSRINMTLTIISILVALATAIANSWRAYFGK